MLIPQNTQAPSHFALADRYLIQFGESTRKSYQTDLEQWFEYAQDGGFEPLSASTSHINLFLRWMEEVQGLSRPTQARKLAAVTGFYRQAQVEGLIFLNPALNVKRPKFSNDSQSTGLSKFEVQLMLMAAEDSSARTFALTSLLALTGLRISEAINADIEDITEERGHKVLRVMRKGSKSSTVVLHSGIHARLMALIGDRTSGPIFITNRGTRYDRRYAWNDVKKLAETAGIEHNVHPHDFRHAFVTMSLDNGEPLQKVQDDVGHASPVTTQRYNRARGMLDSACTYGLAESLGI